MLTLSHAQGNSNRDFWKKITERELNMDSRNQQRLERMKTDTMYSSVNPIKFDKISSFIKKGKLLFKHPKAPETLVAVPTHVKGIFNEEFSWTGNFEEGRGDITIIANNGDIFGRFNIDNDVYEIHDLGHKKNV